MPGEQRFAHSIFHTLSTVGDGKSRALAIESEAEAPGTATPPWSLGKKIAFRLAFCYLLLFTQNVPVNFLRFGPVAKISALYDSLWSAMVPWISGHVFHFSHDFSRSYLNNQESKDTTYIWVETLIYLVIAILATIIWSLLDRRRSNYRWLHKWFMVYIRLVLAAIMIPPGVIKIFPLQFPAPTLSKLLETYGESSPMGLMWTFMGASATYSFFGGATEVLSGLLLVIPRLATLGALITIGIMTNVLALNLGYDVPVKLISFNFILIACFIVLPDLGRLINFFVLNRRVEPAPEQPLFRRKWLNWTAIGLQIAFGVVLFSYNLYRDNLRMERAARTRAAVPIYGIWSVNEFKVDGQVQPPLLTDRNRWQSLIVESPTSAGIQPMKGPVKHLYVQFNRRNGFSLSNPDDPGWSADFVYERPQPDLLFLEGHTNGQSVTVTLQREDESKFSLNSRGFHWIQEAAANW